MIMLTPLAVQLCRSLKHIVDTTIDLQYIIQLHLTGMADNPAHPLSTSGKLAVLQRYHAQWYSLPAHLEHAATFNVIGAYYCQSEHGRDTLGIGPSVDFDYHFAQLPSRIRGIPFKSWILRLPEHTSFFTMDPQQDVLTILKETPGSSDLYLHILELSTGKEHPLASCPLIPLLDGRARDWFKLRISGPYVCVTFMADDLPVIFNWRSGHRRCIGLRTVSFTWIGPTHFLGHIGSAGGVNPVGPYLFLVDLSHPETEGRQWEFDLPEILAHKSEAHLEFDLTCEPATSQGRGSPDSLFDIAEEDSVVVLSARENSFSIFFLASRLLEIARDTAHMAPGTIVVPWKVWGPGHTHTNETFGCGHDYYPYGMRSAHMENNQLYVLDFNRQRAQRRLQARNNEHEEDGSTQIRAYSRTFWRRLIDEDEEATDEQIDELSLDLVESNGLGEPLFVQTVLPYDIPEGSDICGFSEDAIHTRRTLEDRSQSYDVYTL
ncbi:hypothetical protein BDW22DRAFT_1425615 [Trametopsis cervina]|nr:hypothetical protein BDW22DRAFT_1425615 [Trametopsis cervina]